MRNLSVLVELAAKNWLKAAAKNWFKSQVAVRFVAGPKSGVPTMKWTDIGALKDFATRQPNAKSSFSRTPDGAVSTRSGLYGSSNAITKRWFFPQRVRISVALSMRLPMDSPVLATVVLERKRRKTRWSDAAQSRRSGKPGRRRYAKSQISGFQTGRSERNRSSYRSFPLG
jgi:hypothetical protein